MAYYDPTDWIKPTDTLIPDVEMRMAAKKRAYSVDSGIGKSFRPPRGLEFNVVIEETNENIRMVEWQDRIGKLFIDLCSSENSYYRKGHFNNHTPHHNPSAVTINPPHHMHFPTHDYPDLSWDKTKYAYPLKSENDIIEALLKFCSHTNINIHHTKIPLFE